jgi:hypothetical protein
VKPSIGRVSYPRWCLDLEKTFSFQSYIQGIARASDISLTQVRRYMHSEGLIKIDHILLEASGSHIGKIVGNHVEPEALCSTSSHGIVYSTLQSITPRFLSSYNCNQDAKAASMASPA